MSPPSSPSVVASFLAAADPVLAVLPEQSVPQGLPVGIAQQLGDDAFQRGDWAQALGFYYSALRSGSALVDVAKCLLFSARSALYLGEFNAAIKLLGVYSEGFPTDPEGLFYLGRAYQGAHRDYDALNSFNAAAMMGENKPKYLASVAQAAHSVAFESYGFAAETTAATYIAVARSALRAALEREKDHYESLHEQMLLDLDTGDIDAAIASFEAIAAAEKKYGADRVGSAATNLALALSRGGHQAALTRIAYLDKYAGGKRLLTRARALMPGAKAEALPAVFPILAPNARTGRWTLEMLGASGFGLPKAQAMADRPVDSVSIDAQFVVPVREGGKGELMALVKRAHALGPQFGGLVLFQPTATPGTHEVADARVLIIRKALWNEIVSRWPEASWEDLVTVAMQRLRLYVVPQPGGLTAAAWPKPKARKAKRPRVVVLSRHGPRLVGGGEQFLRIAGGQYAEEQGADVLFSGLTKDWTEVTPEWPAGSKHFSTGFLYEDPEAFRAFCLANAVDAVHVISGLGEFVLDACRGLNVRLIYGVHFWREFIPSRVLSRAYYPNVGMADAKPLATMEEILERADFAYVNSDLCADMARQAYRWSPPIIYSVPIAETAEGVAEEQPPALPAKDFVLLVNARADKGWYLLLDMAARLPDVTFVAIAGQSDRDAALSEVHRRGLYNVRVIDRTDRMDVLYQAAKLVVVPSFSFVETFSRVVIEAGRFGTPVLMADSGNLTYLGAGTDLVLPNDGAVWAARVGLIMSSAKAHKKAAEQTTAIAAKYTAETLLSRLRRIPARGDSPRILVCAGSGVGNTCHVSPMVRKLATHYGVPVDVLVAGDFEGSAATMAGSEHVGQVFEKLSHVASRPYDVVLVTHSFGTLVPSFNAHRVLASRDFGTFEPGGPLHESEFNLAFVRDALGIGYDAADVKGYFFGSLTGAQTLPTAGRPVRIALHAGSKGGIWAAKRWPGFQQLAGRLIAHGIEVMSVGIKSEYVEGTLDKTDLSIARMAEELSACDAVVSNDSGVMNVANALGVPLVAIFAPTNAATRGPIHSPVRILGPGTECSPCESSDAYKSRFNEGKCQCISLIGIPQVLAALRELGVRLPKGALA